MNGKVLKDLVRGWLHFLKGAIQNNLTPSAVGDDCAAFGLGEAKGAAVAALYKEHFLALSRSMIVQTLSVNELVDMEWKFGVTTATSEAQTVGSTFLQIKLVLDKGAGKQENVFMELSLPQFYAFLHEMEVAKASIETLA